jgi:uncharacterized membrane protein
VTLERGIELAGTVVEAAGVAILFVGVFAVMASAAYEVVRRTAARELYGRTRRRLGRVLLLGLEVLVAGDIISTVAVEPTLTSVGVLAGIVLIRTFLSWSIELETDGRLPWRRGAEHHPGA